MTDTVSKKQIIAGVCVVAVLAILASFLRFDAGRGLLGRQASVIFVFGDNDKRMFQGDVVDGMSVLQALDVSSKAGNFDIKYAVEKTGDVQLYSIAGKINETGKKWVFYLNGKPIDSKSLGSVMIKRSDSIEARYE